MAFPDAVKTKRLDAVSLLTAYLVALFCIESRLVIGPLGGLGNPAQLIALAGLVWWVYFQVQRPQPSGWGLQPVRIGLLVLLPVFAVSFAWAMAGPIEREEASAATVGLLAVMSWVGVALLAHDGIPSARRFDLLTRRLVLGASAVALLGILQFVFHDPLIRSIRIPGLTANAPLGDLLTRSGFTRPSGTALHPIEFGAVLTTVLPIAITRARTRVRAGGRLRAWLPVLFLALGIVVSNSRSAILCSVVGLSVLSVVWTRATRWLAAAMVLVLFGFVAVAMPGMLGGLARLFLGAGEDGSVMSRTGSYAIVGEFFVRHPWFGRGYSTFLPKYRILDNQYLLLVIEVGVVGLAAFLIVLFLAARSALLARRAASDAFGVEQGQALVAAIASASVGLLTYDGLSFPMATGVLFVVIGLTGQLRRTAALAGADDGVVVPVVPGIARAPSAAGPVNRGANDANHRK